MRALLVPVAAAAAISFASGALAAQTTTGTVKTFSARHHMLTLKGGETYVLPATFKDPGLKSGEKVRITWNKDNGKHMADEVTIVK